MESISEAPSVVSPTVKAGVDEIATILADIDSIIGKIDSESIGLVPDMGELFEDIAEFQLEVKDVILDQDMRIRQLRREVENDIKDDIFEMLEGDISVIIEESVTEGIQQEMTRIGSKPGMTKLVNRLRHIVEANDALLEDGKIHLENSRSRHSNSFLDLYDDFRKPIERIKRKDGDVSDLFPRSLKELFSYDSNKVLRLLEDYNLYSLERHSENLNRFLIFIGINVSIPDQLIDPVDEQPPAYQHGATVGFLNEKMRKTARRPSTSSSSEKSVTSMLASIFI